MNPERITQLAAALESGKPVDAAAWEVAAARERIVDALSRSDIGLNEVRAALRALNEMRYYDQTCALADAWHAGSGAGSFDAELEKHYAQALINLSLLSDAETVLRSGKDRLGASAKPQDVAQRVEFEGLLGRLYKQRFVDHGDKGALAAAVEQYRSRYEADAQKPYWLGINAVALLMREQREGMDPAGNAKALAIAKAILAALRKLIRMDPENAWVLATLSEVCLALGKCADAENWLLHLMESPSLTPFVLESYDRQLRQVWGGGLPGGGSPCADRLVSRISRRFLRDGWKGLVPVAAVQTAAAVIAGNPEREKNFLHESTLSAETLASVLDACVNVGCVTDRNGARMGTGFLVSGASITQAYGEGVVFVTNAHVIGDPAHGALPFGSALVSFERGPKPDGKPIFHDVKEVLFSSPPGDFGVRNATCDHLDVTVVRLGGSPGNGGLRTAKRLPLVDSRGKAYVIGHPRGSGLQISLHDSTLLAIDDDERLVHYRTPTDPGNSGSPVFNEVWEVIAVHHGGSKTMRQLRGTGTYEANEGVALGAVRTKLNG